MNFLTYFRAFSYAMIGVAMLALVLAGGLDYLLAFVFLLVMVVSWKLEGSRWQLPERIGLGIVLLSIPLFYLDWHFQKNLGEPVERLGVTAPYLVVAELWSNRRVGGAAGFFLRARTATGRPELPAG